MTLRQPNTTSVQVEPKGSGAGASADEVHFIDAGGGSYSLEKVNVGNPTAAELVDWHHDRSVYEFAITSAPYVQIDDGSGKIILATSGTPIAILIDGGDGVTLQVSTDLTKTPAGAFYPGYNGDVIAVRFDDRRLRFSQIGSTIFSFEDAA